MPAKQQNKKQKQVPKVQKKKIKKSVRQPLKRTRSMKDSIQEGSEYLKTIEKIQKANAPQSKTSVTTKSRAIMQAPQKKLSKTVKKPIQRMTSGAVKKSQKKQVKTQKKAAPKIVKKVTTVDEAEKKKVAVVPPVLMKKKSSIKDDKLEEEKQPLKKATSGQLNRTDSKLSKKLKSFKSFGEEGAPTAGIIDCVFCMDTTGSMGSYLANAQNTVKKIIEQIENRIKETDISVQFGFVAYRDHPPQDSTYVTKFQGLCSKDDVIKFINTLDANGGGDGPEAVMDGLLEAAKNIKWRQSHIVPSLRYIFHICDAPPHGNEYGGYSSSWSSGCPCGITVDKIAQFINTHQIHYRLIKINSSLDQMSKIFKEKFGNFEESSIENAKDLKIHISDMIMKELLPDEFLDMMG